MAGRMVPLWRGWTGHAHRFCPPAASPSPSWPAPPQECNAAIHKKCIDKIIGRCTGTATNSRDTLVRLGQGRGLGCGGLSQLGGIRARPPPPPCVLVLPWTSGFPSPRWSPVHILPCMGLGES